MNASTSVMWVHPKAEPLAVHMIGPFERLGDGRLITVDDRQTLVSGDNGASWQSRPLFDYGRSCKEYKISQERVLLRTREGTIILSFMNLNERLWLWKDELKDALPGQRLPHYVMRSLDDGKTWQDVQMLHQDWTGEIRNMIQTTQGTLIISSMRMLNGPGRHSVLTYTSDDDGKTWKASNVLDLGGCGHHGGVTEATVTELKDGRLWMLIRTNWGRFWQAISHDQGASWREVGPTSIDASSAPGLLKRLASGRLLLLWNRQYPEGQDSFPLSGGDGIWSEVPVSNHREELSLSLSEDDGVTWAAPVVVARQKDTWISYPRVFEAEPGVLWLTTMQGGLRVVLHEEDFAGEK